MGAVGRGGSGARHSTGQGSGWAALQPLCGAGGLLAAAQAAQAACAGGHGARAAPEHRRAGGWARCRAAALAHRDLAPARRGRVLALPRQAGVGHQRSVHLWLVHHVDGAQDGLHTRMGGAGRGVHTTLPPGVHRACNSCAGARPGLADRRRSPADPATLPQTRIYQEDWQAAPSKQSWRTQGRSAVHPMQARPQCRTWYTTAGTSRFSASTSLMRPASNAVTTSAT